MKVILLLFYCCCCCRCRRRHYYYILLLLLLCSYLQKLQAAIGLDAVLNFEASTQTVLERASKQGMIHSYSYQHVYGLWTNLHTDESIPQSSIKLEQIQQRILAFNEYWPALRRWYSRFGIIINAEMDLNSVCKSASDCIDKVISQVDLMVLSSFYLFILFYFFFTGTVDFV